MHLGMKVDPEGNNIEHTAHPRELVCTRPHPSLALDSGAMTLAKSSDERISACILVSPPFHFPKCCQQTKRVWRQGDFMVVNPAIKGMIILKRR